MFIGPGSWQIITLNCIRYFFPSASWSLCSTHCRWTGCCLWSHWLTHTHTHTHTYTLDSTPLDKGSARRRDLYLITHTSHKRQTCIPPTGFETPNPSKRALNRTATGTGCFSMERCIGIYFSFYYKHNNVSDEPCITFSDHVSCLRFQCYPQLCTRIA